MQCSCPIFSRYLVEDLLLLSHEYRGVEEIAVRGTFNANTFTSGFLGLLETVLS
jgi:hypothetical protein